MQTLQGLWAQLPDAARSCLVNIGATLERPDALRDFLDEPDEDLCDLLHREIVPRLSEDLHQEMCVLLKKLLEAYEEGLVGPWDYLRILTRRYTFN